MRLLTLAFLTGGALTAAAAHAAAGPVTLQSPDGSILWTLEGAAPGHPARYRVERRGEAVIAPSPVGLDFADGPGGDLAIGSVTRRSVDEVVHPVVGKTSRARNRFNEVEVSLEDAATHQPLRIVARAYDDGVAFRYRVPAGLGPRDIRDERTGFHLAADDRCWGLNVGRTTSSHEGEFDPFPASRARANHLYDPGLLCRTPDGRTSLLFAEADLDDYAGLYFRGRRDGGLGFDASLSPLPGRERVAVAVPAGRAVSSSWRVILLADRAGDLIASDTIANLNPAATGDWSWVKPGKAAWDWWSGPYFPGQPARPMNQADLTRLVDFAGASGFPYMLVDEGWALRSGVGGSAPADTDITATQPGLDLPALVAHGARRNVGILLWLQWSQIDKRLDEALDQYARWGVKGIKVDFMDRNDQEMVAFYHRLIAAAAKRHLLVDLHGAYLPTGLYRTWPNFVTQEGVMGAEYNKWSTRVTATHNVSLAYTRMVLGPLDYTPGGFRNRTPADFRINNSPPEVQTTRGQALAMYVVYDSPLQMVSDSPDIYAGAPEFQFIRDVPTSWDETRFLDGDIGTHVALARRKGDTWYVGAMAGAEGCTITLPLSFLKPGSYAVHSWQDGARPTEVVGADRTMRAGDTLQLTLAPAGGAVATIRPSTH
jgi:alpha-glucosidase